MTSHWATLVLNAAFVASVILIWFMIAYQLVLTLAGYLHVARSEAERRALESRALEWPRVAVLVPARNEGRVIRASLEALLALDYPRERLEIVVIDDASSDDTAAIVTELARRGPLRLVSIPAAEGGRGKSRALNVGLATTDAPVIAVYDGDNRPEPQALRYLVAQLVLHPELGAVLGKFRTENRGRNLLTRFINIETLTFQSIVQAGRWQLLRVATLPGTNYVIRRELLTAIGGWDEDAITEDSEMSIRVYMAGSRIKMIPYAVTHEQEPERWATWFRQRTRWVRGNNFVARKFLRQLPRFPKKVVGLEILYLLSLYYVFFVALVVSDVLFVLGLAGVVSIAVPGPYAAVWLLGILLFLLEIQLALSYDREDSWKSVGLAALAYFTYCQLWMLVVAKALYLDLVARAPAVWVRTERFERRGIGTPGGRA